MWSKKKNLMKIEDTSFTFFVQKFVPFRQRYFIDKIVGGTMSSF